jgi:hypothetical protein
MIHYISLLVKKFRNFTTKILICEFFIEFFSKLFAELFFISENLLILFGNSVKINNAYAVREMKNTINRIKKNEK